MISKAGLVYLRRFHEWQSSSSFPLSEEEAKELILSHLRAAHNKILVEKDLRVAIQYFHPTPQEIEDREKSNQTGKPKKKGPHVRRWLSVRKDLVDRKIVSSFQAIVPGSTAIVNVLKLENDPFDPTPEKTRVSVVETVGSTIDGGGPTDFLSIIEEAGEKGIVTKV